MTGNTRPQGLIVVGVINEEICLCVERGNEGVKRVLRTRIPLGVRMVQFSELLFSFLLRFLRNNPRCYAIDTPIKRWRACHLDSCGGVGLGHEKETN